MLRHSSTPRHNWKAIVEGQGLLWHSASAEPYWNEDAYYAFSSSDIERIEEAANNCYKMMIVAGDYIVSNYHILNQFGIPPHFHQYIIDTWDSEPPALNYGRFDFGYDGRTDPKMFEFNCDTPTSLLEASVVQWHWKNDMFGEGVDQFNGIHEAIVERWKYIAPLLPEKHVWFTHADDGAGEDAVNVSYMRDMAEEAGIISHGILINDIGWDGEAFVDLDNYHMSTIQHLYPWEWMVNEKFANNILASADITTWIEPVWKMIWSNKAILPILWKMFPNHKNLLAASFEVPVNNRDFSSGYVSKPILAREGSNILVKDQFGKTLSATGGEYGSDGYVYQERYSLPEFSGKYPVLGVWSVDGAAVGMGIREDGLITSNTAKFVPHIIV
jgi:glutathionylspermidine synthase